MFLKIFIVPCNISHPLRNHGIFLHSRQFSVVGIPQASGSPVHVLLEDPVFRLLVKTSIIMNCTSIIKYELQGVLMYLPSSESGSSAVPSLLLNNMLPILYFNLYSSLKHLVSSFDLSRLNILCKYKYNHFFSNNCNFNFLKALSSSDFISSASN